MLHRGIIPCALSGSKRDLSLKNVRLTAWPCATFPARRRFQPGFEFCHSLSQGLDFRVGSGLRRRRHGRAQESFHRVYRREDGGLHFAQPVLHRVLQRLVSVKCGFQVPHEKLLAHLVRGHDQLPQQLERQSRGLIFRVLGDDLRQDHARQILPRLRVDDLNLAPGANVGGQIIEIHIAAAGGVVQPAIAVFLDQNHRRLHGFPAYVAMHNHAGIS